MDAETVTAVQQLLVSLQPILKVGIAAIVGIALAPVTQANIEHNLANKTWMPQGLKPMLPSIISGALGWLAVHLGIDPVTAVAGASVLAGGTHVVNETSLAADSAQK